MQGTEKTLSLSLSLSQYCRATVAIFDPTSAKQHSRIHSLSVSRKVKSESMSH
ncbi:hypothetical protein RHGRI_020901 [Rhododendron griersonianum]|uniref:Uncharacterized protein n=1 Tax=Rhododendron griersonianum TaxID=479676 RepID=A0AAV6JI37_9ERIC|nr:hypothetical protein RHGRI_020901 [Rhododendron griersonianum]